MEKRLENLNITTIVVKQFYEPSQPLQYPESVDISSVFVRKALTGSESNERRVKMPNAVAKPVIIVFIEIIFYSPLRVN